MNISFKHFFAPICFGIFLSIPGFCFSQTAVVTAGIFGFNTITAPVGGRVIAPVFVKNSVYSGAVPVSGSTFLAAGIASNSLSPSSFTDRPNAPRYYVEITSGSFAGNIYDVAGNDTNGITVYGLPSALNGQSNITIAVRPHFTLGDLASASSGLIPYSDALSLYQTNSSQSTYIYSGSGMVDGNNMSADQVVLYPGSGALLNNSGSASFTFSGLVKTNQTIVPVFAGVTLVAPLDPTGTTTINSENLATILQPYVDAVSLVATDGSLGTTPFYSDGTQLLDQNYSPLDPSVAPIVASGNGFFINATQNRLWTNASALSSY